MTGTATDASKKGEGRKEGGKRKLPPKNNNATGKKVYSEVRREDEARGIRRFPPPKKRFSSA